MAKVKDSDYLFLTTRLRCLEGRLLNGDQMEQMLDAHHVEEAIRLLGDCGYPEPEQVTVETVDEMIAADRKQVDDDLRLFLPSPDIRLVFQIKYDYHNVKTLLKSKAAGQDPDQLLVNLGEVDTMVLKESFRTGETGQLPEALAEAMAKGAELLGADGTPQKAEFAVDQACYQEMLRIAEQSGADFLLSYVRQLIDGVNLRSSVRAMRMGREPEFLTGVLLEGGTVEKSRILSTISAGGGFEQLFPEFSQAAEAGMAVVKGGSLTRFEKLCDEVLARFIAEARFVSFGAAPVVAYLAAKENEYTAIRILIMGKMAGLAPEIIRERLRETYV